MISILEHCEQEIQKILDKANCHIVVTMEINYNGLVLDILPLLIQKGITPKISIGKKLTEQYVHSVPLSREIDK